MLKNGNNDFVINLFLKHIRNPNKSCFGVKILGRDTLSFQATFGTFICPKLSGIRANRFENSRFFSIFFFFQILFISIISLTSIHLLIPPHLDLTLYMCSTQHREHDAASFARFHEEFSRSHTEEFHLRDS